MATIIVFTWSEQTDLPAAYPEQDQTESYHSQVCLKEIRKNVLSHLIVEHYVIYGHHTVSGNFTTVVNVCMPGHLLELSHPYTICTGYSYYKVRLIQIN